MWVVVRMVENKTDWSNPKEGLTFKHRGSHHSIPVLPDQPKCHLSPRTLIQICFTPLFIPRHGNSSQPYAWSVDPMQALYIKFKQAIYA